MCFQCLCHSQGYILYILAGMSLCVCVKCIISRQIVPRQHCATLHVMLVVRTAILVTMTAAAVQPSGQEALSHITSSWSSLHIAYVLGIILTSSHYFFNLSSFLTFLHLLSFIAVVLSFHSGKTRHPLFRKQIRQWLSLAENELCNIMMKVSEHLHFGRIQVSDKRSAHSIESLQQCFFDQKEILLVFHLCIVEKWDWCDHDHACCTRSFCLQIKCSSDWSNICVAKKIN